MSSACVCHLNEWCFYCEVYRPVVAERDKYKAALISAKEETRWGNASNAIERACAIINKALEGADTNE